MKKSLAPLIVLLISCSYQKTTTKETLKDDVEYKCVEKIEENEYSCDFNAFSIKVKDVPAFQNEEFIKSVYDWFVNNAFYGNEVYALNQIYFDGTISDEPQFGSYSPYLNQINIYPNNIKVTSANVVSEKIADKFGKKIDPKTTLEYWKYTLFHEYGHHQTKIYGSEGDVDGFDYHGTELKDFPLNEVGEKHLDIMGIAKNKEFKDKNKIQPIPRFSAGTGESPWPRDYYGATMNNYLWTNAELLTRTFALLTYQLPKELQQEKSVLAFGGIIDDYWWLNHYDANWYEEYKDKEKVPIQEPVDEKLAIWSKFIETEWFNDDANIGNTYIGIQGEDDWHLYIQSLDKKANYTLVNIENKTNYTFDKLDSFTRTQYNWRPFDSRKSKEIKLQSLAYKSSIPVVGEYFLKNNNKIVKDAFDLEENESKYIYWNKKILLTFTKTKDGIKLIVS